MNEKLMTLLAFLPDTPYKVRLTAEIEELVASADAAPAGDGCD